MKSKQEEMEQDFSDVIEKEIPILQQQAANGNISGALDGLYLLEKQTRQGGDFTSCAKVARVIIRICFEAANWNQLNESLTTVVKRRAQSKTVIQAAVQESMSILSKIDDKDVVTELIKTLRSITEGKIFVELESAELTKLLAEIYERDGDVKKAAKVLQEVQVETLSKMEKKDKVNYILEQVRLCVAGNDFIRALILSRKINTTLINQPEFQKEKLKYYELMISYYKNESNHLEIARSYQAIFNTESVQENQEQWSRVLKLLSIYTVLSAHSNEQSDILNRTFLLKKLSDLPLEKQLLKQFLTMELMDWPKVQNSYGNELRSFPDFNDNTLWETFHLRVIEHVRFSLSPFTKLLSLIIFFFLEYQSYCILLQQNQNC